jgi:integrase
MTGMRRGEALGLRWSDIDFNSMRISVRNTFTSVEYKIVASTPKTHRARVIDLDEGTIARLIAHRERRQQPEKTRSARRHTPTA